MDDVNSLLVESEELELKVIALEEFTCFNHKFFSLPAKKQKLMTRQLKAMKAYSKILDARITLEV